MNKITTGMPGIHVWENDDVTECEVSAWAGGDVGVSPVITTVPTQQAALGDALPIAVTIASAANDITTVRFDCDVAKGTVDVSGLAGTSVTAGTRGTNDFTLTGTHSECVAVALLMTYTPIVDTGSDTTVRVTASNGTLSDEETFEVAFWYMLVDASTQADLNATLATLTGTNAVAETTTVTVIATDAGGRMGQASADILTEIIAVTPVALPTSAVVSVSTMAAGMARVRSLLAVIEHDYLVTAGISVMSGHAGEPQVRVRTRERTFAVRSTAA